MANNDNNVAPVAGGHQGLRGKGKLDNHAYWTSVLGGDKFLKGLMFDNLDIFPFIGQAWSEKCIPTLVYLGSLGRFLYLSENGGRPDPTTLTMVTIAETLAPSLPLTLILRRDASHLTFVESVKALMCYENLAMYTGGNQAGYAAEVADLIGGGDNHCFEGIIEEEDKGGIIMPAVRFWPPTADEIIGARLTPREAMVILYYLASHALARTAQTGLNLITHGILSVVKRGNVSLQFLEKIQQGIAQDLNKNIVLNEPVIRGLFQHYGSSIDDTNIEPTLQRWSEQIPQGALRLTLTVMQAAGSGLTAYMTVIEAVKSHPNFSWAKISLYFPLEWAKFQLAIAAVGGNLFYGFRRDLGPARSTQFKSLAWVAKELLVKADAKISLNRYMGWAARVAHQDEIVELIDAYIAVKDAEITDVLVTARQNEAGFINNIAEIKCSVF